MHESGFKDKLKSKKKFEKVNEKTSQRGDDNSNKIKSGSKLKRKRVY